MFGHDHEDKKDDNTQPISTQPINHGLLGIDDDNDAPVGASPATQPTTSPLPVDSTQSSNSFVSGSANSDQDSDSDTKPSEPPTLTPVNSVTPPEPAANPFTVTPTLAPASSADPTTPASDDDLVDIKRQALQELSPLIDHLEQDSEEKFKTTMMMIQASDDKDLIPQAFKAAKEITEEKKRAQALLDIVNEINYFTHKTDD